MIGQRRWNNFLQVIKEKHQKPFLTKKQDSSADLGNIVWKGLETTGLGWRRLTRPADVNCPRKSDILSTLKHFGHGFIQSACLTTAGHRPCHHCPPSSPPPSGSTVAALAVARLPVSGCIKPLERRGNGAPRGRPTRHTSAQGCIA